MALAVSNVDTARKDRFCHCSLFLGHLESYVAAAGTFYDCDVFVTGIPVPSSKCRPRNKTASHHDSIFCNANSPPPQNRNADTCQKGGVNIYGQPPSTERRGGDLETVGNADPESK